MKVFIQQIQLMRISQFLIAVTIILKCSSLHIHFYPSSPNTNNSSINSGNAFDSVSNNQPPFDLCPPERPLYNPQTKLCDDCPKMQEFDGPSQSCLPIIFTTNPQAKDVIMPQSNSIDEQRYTLQKANPTRLIQDCPPEKPYLQSKACINCPNDWHFDLTSEKCVQCKEGTFYNPQTFKCEDSLFYSDVTAPNIVSQTQGYDAWKKKVDALSTGSSRMAKCVKERPFAINGVCVGCSGGTPLFDIDRQQCGSCSQGRTYNPERRLCLASYNTKSSLKRVIANIA